MTYPRPRICWPYVLTGNIATTLSFSFDVYDDPDDPALAAFNGGFNPAPSELLTPEALAEGFVTAIGGAITDAGVSATVTLAGVTIDADGHWNFAFNVPDGATVRMNLDDSALEDTGLLLGFHEDTEGSQKVDEADADSDGVATLTGQWQGQNIFIAAFTHRSDTYDLPGFGRARSDSGAGGKSVTGAMQWKRTVVLEWLPLYRVFTAAEGDAHPNEALQRLWDSGAADFLYSPDSADPLHDPTVLPDDDGVRHAQRYALTQETCAVFEPKRMFEGGRPERRIEIAMVRPRATVASP